MFWGVRTTMMSPQTLRLLCPIFQKSWRRSRLILKQREDIVVRNNRNSRMSHAPILRIPGLWKLWDQKHIFKENFFKQLSKIETGPRQAAKQAVLSMSTPLNSSEVQNGSMQLVPNIHRRPQWCQMCCLHIISAFKSHTDLLAQWLKVNRYRLKIWGSINFVQRRKKSFCSFFFTLLIRRDHQEPLPSKYFNLSKLQVLALNRAFWLHPT